MDIELKRRFDRIDKKLSLLLQQQKKSETWVKVSSVQELTGWNRDQLRRMRDHGVIVSKKNDKGIWYLLESINPLFLKNRTYAEKKES